MFLGICKHQRHSKTGRLFILPIQKIKQSIKMVKAIALQCSLLQLYAQRGQTILSKPHQPFLLLPANSSKLSL